MKNTIIKVIKYKRLEKYSGFLLGGGVLKDEKRQSPALLLLHEFGHAYDAKTYGMQDFLDMKNSKSMREEIAKIPRNVIKEFQDQAEYSAITNYENPAAIKLKNQGTRSKYKFVDQFEKMISVDSIVLINEVKK